MLKADKMFRRSSGEHHGSASSSPAGSSNGHANGITANGSTGRTSPASNASSSGAGGAVPSGSASTSAGGSGSGSGSGSKFRSGGSTLRNATHIGSVIDDWPMYSSQPEDYIIGDVIGFGASSIVYQAAFQPLGGRACAVKVVDLEAFGGDTEVLRRETQLMSLSKHPNVLRVRGCWVEGTKLHIATRLMSSGSMLDIMRFSYPDGFDEVVIATVLKQALEGLTYLHINGWLHRDLKAANMLVDEDGTVLLGDFGVGVFLNESSHGGRSTEKSAAGGDAPFVDGATKSFVGTPCWMAPEVVERKLYGHKADIWSFGITALELAQGRAPLSRLAPVKVLMKTLQDEPPQLDRTSGVHKYSKVMEDFVRVCLQKDPAKRPSAEKLLGHAFFKQAKPKKYLMQAILSGLPPLAERQERRRNMSIASIRNQTSWDFGSGTIHSTLRLGSSDSDSLMPASADPFRGFTGSIATPISPVGSMRSTKIVSIDGEHAIVTPDTDKSFEKLAERFQNRLSMAESGGISPRGSRFGSSRRTRSTDSFGGPRHRKSVSFDFDDSPAPVSAGLTGSMRNRGGQEGIGLESIGEGGRSPAALPVDASVAGSEQKANGAIDVPILELNGSGKRGGAEADPDATPIVRGGDFPNRIVSAASARGLPENGSAVQPAEGASPQLPSKDEKPNGLDLSKVISPANERRPSSSSGGDVGGKKESRLGRLFKKKS